VTDVGAVIEEPPSSIATATVTDSSVVMNVELITGATCVMVIGEPVNGDETTFPVAYVIWGV
jgi:hypothetical protein